MKKSIYLDYAAATPVDSKVLAAMLPFFTKQFYNPSATYLAGRAVREAVNQARSSMASHLGSRPTEIFFTAGATEANNLAIQGLMHEFKDGEILVSSIEHESVLAPASLFKHKKIPVSPAGIVKIESLIKLISNKTILISVMLVNNELGSIQPLREIAALIDRERKQRLKTGNKRPLYLHSDGAQASNYLDLHVSRLGVDMMSLNGGKMYGPKQSGILFIKAGVQLQPLIVGGGQEQNLRSGTENVPAIVGLAVALDIAQKKRTDEVLRLGKIRQLFASELINKIPIAIINGSTKHQAPHILHVTFAGRDNERLMMELDEKGAQCAVGSACSASTGEPSHVLTAIGMSDDLARSSLRFSFGRETTDKDIAYTLNLLKKLTAR